MTHGISQLENRDWVFKQKVQVEGDFRPSTDRYGLVEDFKQLPQVNGDLAPASSDDGNDGATAAEIATMMMSNKHFEVLGSNASSDDVTFSTTVAGIQLQTDGGGTDSVIIAPHLDTTQTAWTGILWGTENQTIWEAVIRIGSSIADVVFWAGLKLTNTATVATDADQVFFRFDAGVANWEATYSIAGVDVETDTSVAVAINTTYKLRIEIDSSRIAHFYINDNKVAVTTALTDNIDLIPYIGLLESAAAAKDMVICYQKISRIWYE